MTHSSHIAHLSSRAFLRLSGADVRDFLQNLITNDMGALSPEHPLYAALLTPQGKYLFDFFLIEEADGEEADGILLDCDAAALPLLERKLALYRLHADVAFARVERSLWAAWGDVSGGFVDPRHADLGVRIFSETKPTADAQLVSEADYDSHRTDLGVPGAGDMVSGETYPLDAHMAELHAISFDKGCYIGQEVVARLKRSGHQRKRLLIVESIAGSLPEGTHALSAGGRALGDVRVHAPDTRRALGLVRLDRLADGEASAMIEGGAQVRIRFPSWLV